MSTPSIQPGGNPRGAEAPLLHRIRGRFHLRVGAASGVRCSHGCSHALRWSSHDLTKASPRGSAVPVADHRVAGDLAAVDHHDRSLPEYSGRQPSASPLASQEAWSPSSGVQSARVRSGPRRCPVTLPRVGRARDLRQGWASGGWSPGPSTLTELASSLSRQVRGQMLPCQLSTVNSPARPPPHPKTERRFYP